MLPTNLFLLFAILIAENCYAVVADDEPSAKCGPNEVFACGSACDTTCATLGDTCPIVNIKCNDKCYCVDGYARDRRNVCVPIKQCPARFTCPKTQVYNPCPLSCPGLAGCEAYILGLHSAPVCIASPVTDCKPKCECKTGLILKSEKECVKPEQCCADPNAEVVSCPNPCHGGTCESPEFVKCDTACRIRGCQCKSGYVLDAQGKCILLSKCPKCGPNEVFACSSACDTTCATLGDTCPIINTKCNDKCYCVDGFARDRRNVCIPIKQCSAKFTCPKTQVYNPCPLICPGPPGCAAYLLGLHSAPVCIASPVTECKPKCECKTGLILKSEKECVKPEQCCEDPNAEVVSCPNPCDGGTCESPEFADCKAACRIRGCQCKSGYVLDAQGKCIILRKCRT